MTSEPGTARRALLGWRNTAAAMLPLWMGVPFLGSEAVNTEDAWQDLAFVVLTLLAYCAGVLIVVPAFAFTLGRWIDRRTGAAGLRRGVATFGLYGAGFGLVLVLLLGLGGLTLIGVIVLLLAPTLTAVAGRLLMELRGTAWSIILWAAFALAIAVALAVIGTLLFSG